MYKTIGLGSAAAGTVKALSDESKATQLKELGKGTYNTAIQLTIASVPLVISIYKSFEVVDINIKEKINFSLEQWKTTIKYLLTEQAERTTGMIDEVIGRLKRLTSREKTKAFFIDKNYLHEINNLKILIDEVGLDNHKCSKLINTIYDELVSISNDKNVTDEIVNSFFNKMLLGSIGFIIAVIPIAMNPGAGVISGMYMIGFLIMLSAHLFYSKSRKKMIKILNELKQNKDTFSSINNKDFDFELLGIKK